MKAVYITILLLISYGCLFGQKITYPELKKNGTKINDFVPQNWRIVAITYGDLNKDSQQDVVLVVQNKDSKFIDTYVDGENEIIHDANPRILIALIKNAKDGGYTLADYSNTFILRNSNPTRYDPFISVAINSNGILAIDFCICYLSTSEKITNATYKFRYQNEKFELIGADIFDLMRPSQETKDYSVNFMTRKMYITSGNMLKNTKPVEELKSFKLDKLKTFETIIQPFTWDVEGVKL